MSPIVQVLLSGGVMLAIAVIFGVILVLVSDALTVRRDERIDRVENLLAKSNCGGCGRAGCAQFAEALVKGEAKLSDCRATPKANKEKIAEILGGGEVGEETVAVVHCCGGNACFNKYDYQGYGNCASCELIAGGVKACPVGCIGKKTCADVCPHGAVSVGDGGYSVVDKEKCVSCGACIADCPKGIIGRIPKNAAVYIACSNHGKGKEVTELCAHGCIGCGLCARTCPVGAIEMKNGLPEIDYAKCIGCKQCAAKCPRKCIFLH